MHGAPMSFAKFDGAVRARGRAISRGLGLFAVYQYTHHRIVPMLPGRCLAMNVPVYAQMCGWRKQFGIVALEIVFHCNLR